MGSAAAKQADNFRRRREGRNAGKNSFREVHLENGAQTSPILAHGGDNTSLFSESTQVCSVRVKADDLHREWNTSISSVLGGKTADANSPSQMSARTSHYSLLEKLSPSRSPNISKVPEQKERSLVQRSPLERSPLQELQQLQQELKRHGFYNDGHAEYAKQTPRWNRNCFIHDQNSNTCTIGKSPSRRRSRLTRSQTSDAVGGRRTSIIQTPEFRGVRHRSVGAVGVEIYKLHKTEEGSPFQNRKPDIDSELSTPRFKHVNSSVSSLLEIDTDRRNTQTSRSRRRRGISVDVSKLPKMEEHSAVQIPATTSDKQLSTPSTPRFKPAKMSKANAPETDADRRTTQTPRSSGRRQKSVGATDASKLQKMEEGSSFQNRATTSDEKISTPRTPRYDGANACTESTPETDAELDFALPRLCSSSLAESMYPNTAEHRIDLANRTMNSSKTVTSICSSALRESQHQHHLGLFARASAKGVGQRLMPSFSPRLPANGPADPDIHRCLQRVATFIIRCIHQNPAVDDEVPSVDFLVEFLMALFRVEQIETPCCVLLYVYLKRLKASNMAYLNGQNWRSALIGASLLSTKFFDDFSTRNSDFALALSEYTLSDINGIEAAFLVAIDWRLHVTRSEYTGAYFHLLNGRRTRSHAGLF